MTSVTPKAAFRYGAYLFAYWLVLALVGGALVAGGGYIIIEQPVDALGDTEANALAALGGFLAFCGIALYGSGQFGLAYKLVADGVSTGQDAGRGLTPAPAQETQADDTVPSEFRPRRGPDSTPASGPSGRSESRSDRGPGVEPEREPSSGRDPGERAPTQESPPARNPPESGQSTPVTEGASDPLADDETASTDQMGDRDTQPQAGMDASEAGPTEAGDGQTDASDGEDDEPVESPEDVASESDIAAELGFANGDDAGADSSEPNDAGASDSRSSGPESETGGDPLAGDDVGGTGEDPLAGDDAAGAGEDPLAGGEVEEAGSDPLAGDDAAETGEDPLDVDEWETADGTEETDENADTTVEDDTDRE